ncbi:9574_t:CDS:2, partial [Scutellospora calospora]
KLDINGERLKQLQNRLQNIIYLIIDEKSMIGRRMLALINLRLRQAFPEHNNTPFGGRSIILVGDFGQLPPVLDHPMYTTTILRDPLSNNGIVAYKQFREVYKLDIVQRQSGDSEEQRNFRDILLRLCNGKSTISNWRILTDVNLVNMNMLRSLNILIAKILAVHNRGDNEAKNANSDIANSLEAELLLAKGARIMLTANLWTEAGLVNSSIGTVQGILFEEDQRPPALPTVVFILFDNYRRSTVKMLNGIEVVPI